MPDKRACVSRSIALAAFAAMATPAWAASPPAGVYACYEAKMTFNGPGCIRSSLGCSGITVENNYVMMFGLIDGANYADFDGHRGSYAFDAASGTLSMKTGPRQGWTYKKVGDWSFSALDPQGKEQGFTCPLDPNRNPAQRGFGFSG